MGKLTVIVNSGTIANTLEGYNKRVARSRCGDEDTLHKVNGGPRAVYPQISHHH